MNNTCNSHSLFVILESTKCFTFPSAYFTVVKNRDADTVKWVKTDAEQRAQNGEYSLNTLMSSSIEI
jgi:hypothetical protein